MSSIVAAHASDTYVILSERALRSQQMFSRGLPRSYGPFWTPDERQAHRALARLKEYLRDENNSRFQDFSEHFSSYRFQIIGVIRNNRNIIKINGICAEMAKNISKFYQEYYIIYSPSRCYFESEYDDENRSIIDFFTESAL